MSDLTDDELVKRVRHGETRFLRDLFHRWEASVYRIAWRIVGNAHDAEETRQSVFLRMIEHPELLPAPESFPSWVRRCTINASIALIRRRNRRDTEPLPRDLTGSIASPDWLVQITEETQRLQDAMDRVEPDERAILSLRFDEQLTFAEIGAALERPPSTIKSQYERLLERLKAALMESSRRTEETDRHD